ncbi:MAG: NADH-quinone oxidoreductase subunit NuoH [Deltaproteobacteria bacterium]|jgi:NADH-quinone oxidoreductase subunit H|nr:NADH-quinone oxidoreductase subunit NuoH [Deltaproteobacteria bacterium]MBT4526150.1 NADH-quinone oxidoreductase subunit NuoH [Deltaproteobacteria bacterium]
MNLLTDTLGMTEFWANVVIMLIVCTIVFAVFALMSGITSWAERRIAGRMQSRYGCNRVGPQGILQFVADAVKLILKEDLIPDGADRFLYKITPYLCLMGVLATLVVLPLGSRAMMVADLNVGVLYFISITSIVVIGILMAGWSSNNKWSLLGGMRSAAQIVSYEIPVAMSLLTPILIAGSLSVGDLLDSQGWLPWEWTAFQTPFSALAFFVFFIGSLAEGNRTPFDLPEAESELVSGFNTEYSGFRFAVFFMAEYGNVFLIGLSTTALFLGGPNLPGFLQGNPFLSVAVMMLKTIFIMFVVIWLRWTLPRFRIDQLMDLSWKYLLPCALIAFFGQSVFMLVAHQIPAITQITSIVVFIVFLLIMIKFIGRIRTNYKEQSIPVGLN